MCMYNKEKVGMNFKKGDLVHGRRYIWREEKENEKGIAVFQNTLAEGCANYWFGDDR